ncbi:DNA helicase PcrA [Kitasatospora sp. Ki12]
MRYRLGLDRAGAAHADVSGRILVGMTNYSAGRRPLPTSPFKRPAEPPRKHFAVGDRVTHDGFGLGRVIGVEGQGDIAVLVDFGARQERIAHPYTAMFKL